VRALCCPALPPLRLCRCANAPSVSCSCLCCGALMRAVRRCWWREHTRRCCATCHVCRTPHSPSAWRLRAPAAPLSRPQRCCTAACSRRRAPAAARCARALAARAGGPRLWQVWAQAEGHGFEGVFACVNTRARMLMPTLRVQAHVHVWVCLLGRRHAYLAPCMSLAPVCLPVSFCLPACMCTCLPPCPHAPSATQLVLIWGARARRPDHHCRRHTLHGHRGHAAAAVQEPRLSCHAQAARGGRGSRCRGAPA